MPNWCSGWMKIRGKKQDILDFFKNEVAICTYDKTYSLTTSEAVFENDEYEYEYILKQEKNQKLYLRNSRRFFFLDKEITFYNNEQANCYLNLEIQQAWHIDVGKLLTSHSKKYNIDFNIYASECGMQFEQYITIVNGKVIRNDVIKYDDFGFEAINPSLGG